MMEILKYLFTFFFSSASKAKRERKRSSTHCFPLEMPPSAGLSQTSESPWMCAAGAQALRPSPAQDTLMEAGSEAEQPGPQLAL